MVDDNISEVDTFATAGLFEMFLRQVSEPIFSYFGNWILLVETSNEEEAKQFDLEHSVGIYEVLKDITTVFTNETSPWKGMSIQDFIQKVNYKTVKQYFTWFVELLNLQDELSEYRKDFAAKMVTNTIFAKMLNKKNDCGGNCGGCEEC